MALSKTLHCLKNVKTITDLQRLKIRQFFFSQTVFGSSLLETNILCPWTHIAIVTSDREECQSLCNTFKSVLWKKKKEKKIFATGFFFYNLSNNFSLA